MKSSERRAPCPICGVEVSIENFSRHVSAQANLEKKSNLHIKYAGHLTYKNNQK